jgi:hypothetical protein
VDERKIKRKIIKELRSEVKKEIKEEKEINYERDVVRLVLGTCRLFAPARRRSNNNPLAGETQRSGATTEQESR